MVLQFPLAVKLHEKLKHWLEEAEQARSQVNYSVCIALFRKTVAAFLNDCQTSFKGIFCLTLLLSCSL